MSGSLGLVGYNVNVVTYPKNDVSGSLGLVGYSI